MADMGISEIIMAASAAIGAGTAVYSATQKGPKAAGQPSAAKEPNQNVYKDRNAQNALIQGSDSTGTGSLLSSPNVASNTLLGQ